MKQILSILCIIAVVFAVAADEATHKRGRPRSAIKASGGIVEKAYTGRTIQIVNASTSTDKATVDAIALKIRRSAQLPVEASAGEASTAKSPIPYARAVAKSGNAGATVVLVESNELPIILGSPDEKWAILNVAPLAGDQAKFESRLNKGLWGAMARALGTGSSGDWGCVLAPFSNVAQLDAIPATEPSPTSHNALIDVAKVSGINMIYFATYRTACQQGWAPQPANDEQKKIWNEIHSIPDKPITIEFDPKKDK